MAIILDDSLDVGQQKLLDSKRDNDGAGWSSVAEVMGVNGIPFGKRSKGQELYIDGKEYWWPPNDSDLTKAPILKESGGGGIKLWENKSYNKDSLVLLESPVGYYTIYTAKANIPVDYPQPGTTGAFDWVVVNNGAFLPTSGTAKQTGTLIANSLQVERDLNFTGIETGIGIHYLVDTINHILRLNRFPSDSEFDPDNDIVRYFSAIKEIAFRWKIKLESVAVGDSDDDILLIGAGGEIKKISFSDIAITTTNIPEENSEEAFNADGAYKLNQKILTAQATADVAQEDIDAHEIRNDNPHNVTKKQVGLENVPDVDATNPANINQSASYRFVTDDNINTWNDASYYTTNKLKSLGFSVFDDNFEDGTVSSDLTLSAGWEPGTDGITINSNGGWGNSVLFNKYTTIDRVSTRALIEIIDTSSVFSVIRKPIGLNQFGTVAEVNCSLNVIRFYSSWNGGTTAPSIIKSIAIPFAIVANRKYLVELIKDRAKHIFIFTDTTTHTNSVSLVYDNETETLSGAGRQWSAPGVMFMYGNINLKRFTYSSLFTKTPKLLITGHSFVEGYALIDEGDINKSYSNLMYKDLAGNVSIAGRGGETIDTLNTRTDIDYYYPSYHMVDIGSNDTTYSAWLAGMQIYIAKIIAIQSIPILCTIVPRSDRQSFINQANNWIRLSGYSYIDFAKAVTLNNDGLTQDPSLFWTDSVHPNIAGNAKMFEQIKIDAPYIWDGITKIPITDKSDKQDSKITEIVKTSSFSVSSPDGYKLYIINSSSAVTVTFPSSLPAGMWWEFLSIGTGQVTFVNGSGVTLLAPNSMLKLSGQYSSSRAISRPSNQIVLGGDLML